MSPKGERVWTRSLWAVSLLLEAGALFLISQALLAKESPMPALEEAPYEAQGTGTQADARTQELLALAKKRMTQAIPPPSAPRAVPLPKPPLETLLRLSGIVDRGEKAVSEAIIEFVPGGQSKSYKPGDLIATSGARVARITDSVLVEYDGKTWILAFTGVEEVDPSAAANPSTEPERPEQ